MEQQSFGQTLKFNLSLSSRGLSVGPAWAAIAGALSAGSFDVGVVAGLQLVGLWLLVDPILGTVWALTVDQGLWRRVTQARLPAPAARGFWLPYAQPGSGAGQLVLLVRRYQVWWRTEFWPDFGGQTATFTLGVILALLVSAALGPALFWLTVLALSLTVLAGLRPPDLSTPGGGRWQSVVQWLLPWLMGLALFSAWSRPALLLGLCFWAVFLGGLRTSGHHQRAEWLFFGGQMAAILLLLGLRLLPGAVVLSACLLAQLMIKQQFGEATLFLRKAQPYLIVGILTAGLSLGVG